MPAAFRFDHDLHIHSLLSACSRDPEQTPARLLQYAKEYGLRTLCLTDHYWDASIPTDSGWYRPQDFDHIAQSLPLPQSDGVRFWFGCETDLTSDLRLGIPSSRFDDFKFIVIPTTHLHMSENIRPEDAPFKEARARLWAERLDALLDLPLPFEKIGIAHLACPLLVPSSHGEYLEALDMIPTETMERVFAKAAKTGVGIELNSYDLKCPDNEVDTVFRMFRIAKSMGCKFYFGSDAHHPDAFDHVGEIFARAIRLLDLRECDRIAFLDRFS
jgi:histidinol phosphatase-like PHP family hydrolase